MKKVLFHSLLLCTLALASCAPVAQLLQPAERSTLTRDGSSLVLTNPGPDALTGDPTKPTDGPALTIDTSDTLRLDAVAQAWCTSEKISVGLRWSCNVPNLLPGTQIRVRFEDGTVIDATVLAYRPSSGVRPVSIWLK
ncbi:hypothetical protein [Deinococcus sp. QL22]|uniref:hypothetical protein n=1 Tax=Deinococcus sp. QL22 TaxID=2939437 RepID=UPI002017B691|nr:hypothetical protein [Deinococcus sp. QL22]UQN10346.1 hypothetical protein M1R55_29790 [Deinococcus sp. QL22]UQN10480.1 hypothetical protein M1R55_29115 [Deinococcus sp. QL22]